MRDGVQLVTALTFRVVLIGPFSSFNVESSNNKNPIQSLMKTDCE